MGEAGGTNISKLSARASLGCSSELLHKQQRRRLAAVPIGAGALKCATAIIVIQHAEKQHSARGDLLFKNARVALTAVFFSNQGFPDELAGQLR